MDFWVCADCGTIQMASYKRVQEVFRIADQEAEGCYEHIEDFDICTDCHRTRQEHLLRVSHQAQANLMANREVL